MQCSENDSFSKLVSNSHIKQIVDELSQLNVNFQQHYPFSV